jgi:hypothetical protein
MILIVCFVAIVVVDSVDLVGQNLLFVVDVGSGCCYTSIWKIHKDCAIFWMVYSHRLFMVHCMIRLMLTSPAADPVVAFVIMKKISVHI